MKKGKKAGVTLQDLKDVAAEVLSAVERRNGELREEAFRGEEPFLESFGGKSGLAMAASLLEREEASFREMPFFPAARAFFRLGAIRAWAWTFRAAIRILGRLGLRGMKACTRLAMFAGDRLFESAAGRMKAYVSAGTMTSRQAGRLLRGWNDVRVRMASEPLLICCRGILRIQDEAGKENA